MEYARGLKNVLAQYAISNDTAVRLLDFVEHPNQPTPTNEDGVVALTRRARGIARRRATRDARATLSRGETRRSEKFESRDTQRAGRGARIARRASIEAPSVVLVFKVS